MQQYLLKYLILHKSLAIPKLGLFYLENLSAKIDSTNHLMYPPSQVVRFSQEQVVPDRPFYDFMVKETGADLVDVMKYLNDYAHQMMAKAKESNGAVMEGMGVLKEEEGGHLLFFSDRPLDYLLPQLNIHQSISIARSNVMKQAFFKREELEGDELKELLGQEIDEVGNDNWWVYALILLLLGVGALMFYYV